MLSVQKKMDYRSRGIANGDTGDKTGAKGVLSQTSFLSKKKKKTILISRLTIRVDRFEANKIRVSNAKKD